MSRKQSLRVDRLSERLAAPELELARNLLRQSGAAALVASATAIAANQTANQARLEALRLELAAHPEQRQPLIATYLHATVSERSRLTADLRALAANRAGVMDITALAERVALETAASERKIEAVLAVLVTFAPWPVTSADADGLAWLARLPGQWSRRTRALELLRRLARYAPRARSIALAVELASAHEQHWVQPAAVALLAAFDPAAAARLVLERLARPGPENDLLVRERFVHLCVRRIFRGPARRLILARAARDPSDHVRISSARTERRTRALARIAGKDFSHKVRAVALISLAKHQHRRTRHAFASALERDPHSFVVVTAAQLVAKLAHQRRSQAYPELLRALAFASRRSELTPDARIKVGEALAEASVCWNVQLRSAYDTLARAVSTLQAQQMGKLTRPEVTALTDANLGLVLSVLNRADAPLGVDRDAKGVLLYKGEPRRFALWRALFELLHPTPSKRQTQRHTIGRVPRGALRAPPGGMAETTRTNVPGERVLAESAGDWGRHLPLVDDLRSTGLFAARTVSLVGPAGVTKIRPPAGWFSRLRAYAKLTFAYRELSDLRTRSLESEDPDVQAAYAREVARATGIDLQFEPHLFVQGEVVVRPEAPRGLALAERSELAAPSLAAVAVIPHAREFWRELASYLASSTDNRLSHLGAFAAFALLALTGRAIALRQGVERDRKGIPLVIGGWGTRGKSGTERLKAAIFQGFGHECLVKTTGCEAMFIHAVPGLPAREIFLYRPYEKVTIWEQRSVLRLARDLGVRVFLWECMALQPDLVRLLEGDWMKDDWCTITNAYPDHEDLQGPTGYDVANVISEFIPHRGRVLTCEDQMLPLFREKAARRGTRLSYVAQRSAELIPDDLLARFPYQEHPRNIALVATLARTFGLNSNVAIAEMADHVVPDLGVLKTFPAIQHQGRSLSFTNGMSANERMGAISNWARCGFDKHDPELEPGRWIVTVVNNREDRPARSEVFARLVVEDTSAHCHVLIGGNVRGLEGQIQSALARHLSTIDPTHDLPKEPSLRLQAVHQRIDAAFRRLKVGGADVSSVANELSALGWAPIAGVLIEEYLAPQNSPESLASASRAIDALLAVELNPEQRPFLVATLARRRVVRSLHELAERQLVSHPRAVAQAFAASYRDIFTSQIRPLYDADMLGDELIGQLALQVPPGAHASVMGLQNIKGTGLDFVYRWVSIDTVVQLLKQLDFGDSARRERALKQLLAHDDYGAFDAQLALTRVSAQLTRATDTEHALCESLVESLQGILAAKAKAAGAAKLSLWERTRAAVVETFDHLAAIGRQRTARALVAGVVSGRVSRVTAAFAMREIVKAKI